MNHFNDFIQSLDLGDLHLVGGRFTWLRNQEKITYCRLDRFLISVELLEKYKKVIQKILPWSLSNHNPIILCEDEIDWDPKPSRFFNHWVDDKGFGDFIRSFWNVCQGSHNLGVDL
ncbi:hypothetical protein REPUB_Repub20aG0103000 [Reevesia pubescens]